MKSLVVYESVFGNTAEIARAIGEGLVWHGEVTVADVRGARPEYAERFDLLVVGAPARAFAPEPGDDHPHAVHRHPPHAAGDVGLQDWLAMLPADAHTEQVAAFDIRVRDSDRGAGSTASRATHVVRHLGYLPLGKPTSFYVEEPGGPLVPGERERAVIWGNQLGTLLFAKA